MHHLGRIVCREKNEKIGNAIWRRKRLEEMGKMRDLGKTRTTKLRGRNYADMDQKTRKPSAETS